MHRSVGSATARGAVELPESGREEKQPWRIDQATGNLAFGNAQPTGTAVYPHFSVDPTNSVFVGASYGGGWVGVNTILSEGMIGEPTHVVTHSGPPGPSLPD